MMEPDDSTMMEPTPTAEVPEWEMKWAALQEAAAQEGQLVGFLCCGVGGGLNIRGVLEVFEDKFNIEVVNSTGSSREQWDRVQAEREAGRYTLDVWMGGLRTSNSRLLPAGALAPLKPLIFHPRGHRRGRLLRGHPLCRPPRPPVRAAVRRERVGG